MSASQGLTHLEPGDRIDAPLLVADVERRCYGSEKDCTVLILGDASGRIGSRPIWDAEQERIAGISKGDVVRVAGIMGSYRGKRQIEIASIRVLRPGVVSWWDLVPSVGNVAPYWEQLDRWRAEIRRPRLRRTLALFYDDAAFRRRYELCPASLFGHHAKLGGLLRHTWEVAAAGRAISAACGADPDLVLAGALLHDIGKLESYVWEGAFAMTEPGSLLGHVVLGALMLDRRVKEEHPAPCTDQERTLLYHLVLSHHGRLEFGAAVQPMTLEAEVLHYADNASAKTASMSEALADQDNFLGNDPVSARGIWQLDRRRVYRDTNDWGLLPAPGNT